MQAAAAEMGIDPQLLVGEEPLPEQTTRDLKKKLLTRFFGVFMETPATSLGFEVQGEAKSLEEVEANGKWAVEIRRRGDKEYRLDITLTADRQTMQQYKYELPTSLRQKALVLYVLICILPF